MLLVHWIPELAVKSLREGPSPTGRTSDSIGSRNWLLKQVLFLLEGHVHDIAFSVCPFTMAYLYVS